MYPGFAKINVHISGGCVLRLWTEFIGEKPMIIRKTVRNNSVRFTIVILLIIVCAAARLHAQGYAKIVGTVTDPSGAVIPAASVTAEQTNSGTVVATVRTGS